MHTRSGASRIAGPSFAEGATANGLAGIKTPGQVGGEAGIIADPVRFQRLVGAPEGAMLLKAEESIAASAAPTQPRGLEPSL
jgi:hypothetical protein